MEEKKKVKRKPRGRTIVRKEKKPKKVSHKPTREPTQIGYMRVSTEMQDHALQYDALTKAGVDPDHIFQDTMTGSKITRDGLTKCLKFCIPGDTIVVWKIDRFSRKTKDMLELLEGLELRGISIKSTTQPLDTSTPMGKMILTSLAMFAEFERETIRERVKAGIKAKRENEKNVRWGRQPQADYDPVAIRRDKRNGLKVREIAKLHGVSIATVSRCCAPQKKRKEAHK